MQRFILSALALAFVAGLAPVALAQNGASPSEEFTMGFVDMERLIKEHPQTKAKTDTFQREFETRMEALRNQFSEMNNLKEGLDVLQVGSPEYLATLKRIKKIEATLELERKIIRIEFQLKVVDALKGVYEACQAVVSQVAKERGMSAVAMISSSAVGGRTRSELVGDILTRPFVYAHDSLNITDDVLSKLGVDPNKASGGAPGKK